MNKKIFIQLTLLTLIIFLLTIFFRYYNNNTEKTANNLNTINNTDKKIKKSNENIIKDIRYFSKDAQNNSYEISCEWLNKNLNNPDIRIYDCTCIYLFGKFK